MNELPPLHLSLSPLAALKRPRHHFGGGISPQSHLAPLPTNHTIVMCVASLSKPPALARGGQALVPSMSPPREEKKDRARLEIEPPEIRL